MICVKSINEPHLIQPALHPDHLLTSGPPIAGVRAADGTARRPETCNKGGHPGKAVTGGRHRRLSPVLDYCSFLKGHTTPTLVLFRPRVSCEGRADREGIYSLPLSPHFPNAMLWSKSCRIVSMLWTKLVEPPHQLNERITSIPILSKPIQHFIHHMRLASLCQTHIRHQVFVLSFN